MSNYLAQSGLESIYSKNINTKTKVKNVPENARHMLDLFSFDASSWRRWVAILILSTLNEKEAADITGEMNYIGLSDYPISMVLSIYKMN